MSTTDPKSARDRAREFATQHAVPLAAEIIEWQSTAVLRDGLLRELATICRPFAAHDALQVAESIATRAVLELCAAPAAQPALPRDDRPFDPGTLRLLFDYYGVTTWAGVVRSQAAEIEMLNAAAMGEKPVQDALDAARYRWLRNSAPAVLASDPEGFWRFTVHAPGAVLTPLDTDEMGELDAVIDAAMGATGGGNG